MSEAMNGEVRFSMICRSSAGARARSAFVNGLLTTFSCVIIMPFLLMVSTAIKAPGETQMNRGLIPQHVELGKFLIVWNLVDVPRLGLNSFIIAAATVIMILLFGSLAAYAFARADFALREPLYFLFLVGLMVPGAALIVPLYQLNVHYGLMNTYFAVIGPSVALGLPFSILLLRGYFRTLPREIEDAAFIDGASRLEVYWQVLLPLTKPALLTVGIFAGLGAWNDFLFPLLFLTRADLRTLPLGIIEFETTTVNIQYEHQFALLVMMTAPIVVAFLLLQRYFIGGLTAGAVKL